MFDRVREFIWSQQVHGCYGASGILATLDAERKDCEKEVADLKQRISELEAQLQDEKKEE